MSASPSSPIYIGEVFCKNQGKKRHATVTTVLTLASGLYYKQVTIVMTLACIIKLETIVIDDASQG
jgi:hypothetical protein